MGLPIFIIEAGTEVGIKIGNELRYYEREDVAVYSTTESLVVLYDTKNDVFIVEGETTDYKDPKEASVRDLIHKIKVILAVEFETGLTIDELEAIKNANNPNASNPFATIDDLTGFQRFLGNWDANTNTPTLTSGVGTIGDTYRVSVAGTTDLDGITDWQVGDGVYFDGTVWRKDDNSDQVSSVFGRTGAVVAQASDYDADQVDFTPNGDITSTNVQSAIVELRDDTDTKLSAKEDTANKGAANGYAPLDGSSLVPEANLPNASETNEGIAEIATQAEVDAGTDDNRIVTPLKLANYSGFPVVLKQKAGVVLNATFTGNPKTATVTFGTAFADTNYSVSLVCNTTGGTSYTPVIENIATTGFDINMTVNNISNLTDVRWIAVKHGEN
jgi:hypothetical protein